MDMRRGRRRERGRGRGRRRRRRGEGGGMGGKKIFFCRRAFKHSRVRVTMKVTGSGIG
jgi:hypothetical protein